MKVHPRRCGSYDTDTNLVCTLLKGHGRLSSGHDHGVMNTGPYWGWTSAPWEPFGDPLPTFVPQPQLTECPACARLAHVGIQCNGCRRDAPNRRSLIQREIVRRVREDGMTPAEAEASMGVTAGKTIG